MTTFRSKSPLRKHLSTCFNSRSGLFHFLRKILFTFQTINLFVKSLLSTDTSAHLKSAWIGAERTKTGAWKWMDGSNFVFSNFVTDNSDDGNAIIGVDGRWESQV